MEWVNVTLSCQELSMKEKDDAVHEKWTQSKIIGERPGNRETNTRPRDPEIRQRFSPGFDSDQG